MEMITFIGFGMIALLAYKIFLEDNKKTDGKKLIWRK